MSLICNYYKESWDDFFHIPALSTYTYPVVENYNIFRHCYKESWNVCFFTFRHFSQTPIQLLKITIFCVPIINLCFLLLLMSLYYEVFNLMMSITCTSKIEEDILQPAYVWYLIFTVKHYTSVSLYLRETGTSEKLFQNVLLQ